MFEAHRLVSLKSSLASSQEEDGSGCRVHTVGYDPFITSKLAKRN